MYNGGCTCSMEAVTTEVRGCLCWGYRGRGSKADRLRTCKCYAGDFFTTGMLTCSSESRVTLWKEKSRAGQHLGIVVFCLLSMFVLDLSPYTKCLSQAGSTSWSLFKGVSLWMLFCVFSAVLYYIPLKSHECSLNWFIPLHQKSYKNILKLLYWTTTAEVTQPLTSCFLEIPNEFVSGAWNSYILPRQFLLTCQTVLDYSEIWYTQRNKPNSEDFL